MPNLTNPKGHTYRDAQAAAARTLAKLEQELRDKGLLNDRPAPDVLQSEHVPTVPSDPNDASQGSWLLCMVALGLAAALVLVAGI